MNASCVKQVRVLVATNNYCCCCQYKRRMSLVYTSPNHHGKGPRHSIYIGGRKEAKSLEKLRRWGVTRILNVTPTKEVAIQAGVANYFEKSHPKEFTYKRIPIYDDSTGANLLKSQYEEEVVSFIFNSLFHGSVLVHCRQGISRSTTCVIMFLIRKVHFTVKEALQTIQRRRPQAQPNPAFMEMLAAFQKNQKETQDTKSTETTKRPRPVGPALPPQQAKKRILGPCRGPQLEAPQVGDGVSSEQKEILTMGPVADDEKKVGRNELKQPLQQPDVAGPPREVSNHNDQEIEAKKPSDELILKAVFSDGQGHHPQCI
eukprot:Nitzschia sp. Nitz4//scaffold97_size77645//28066//29234//NITZ4_005516-RA/size77645-snap-gene-0.110-mRNA-1//-1//CDS//3329560650//380//frame0